MVWWNAVSKTATCVSYQQFNRANINKERYKKDLLKKRRGQHAPAENKKAHDQNDHGPLIQRVSG